MSILKRKREYPQHAINDDLETSLLKIRPKLKWVNDLHAASLHDPTIKPLVEKERNELHSTINDLAKNYKVSFIDAMSKLQGEKFKNEILEGREKAKEREKKGEGDDDVTDIVDENGVLL